MSNGKMPWSKFFWSDWAKDAQLAQCSLATQGAWMRLLCAMHDQNTDRIQGTIEGLARIVVCTVDEMKTTLTELASTGTAEVTETEMAIGTFAGHVPIYAILSRRMSRDCLARKYERERKQRQRFTKMSRKCPDDVPSSVPPMSPIDLDLDLDLKTNTVVNESSNFDEVPMLDDMASCSNSGEIGHNDRSHTGASKNDVPVALQKMAVRRDLEFDAFGEAFERRFDIPYRSTKADFIQLARLRKATTIDPVYWHRAIENYLASPMGKYTCADLATRVEVFAAGHLDRFNKPVDAHLMTNRNEALKFIQRGDN